MAAKDDGKKTPRSFIKGVISGMDPADQEFELAVGRFMIAWSNTEAELYRVLTHYSGVTNPVARALFSGVRARGMMDYIRSIAHNTEMAADRFEDLDYVFKQMAAINTMRDHLVHHMSASYSYKDTPSRRVIANTRASRYGNAVGFEISADLIDSMSYDLYAIANHLNMHWGPRTGPFEPWREDYQSDVPTPWTYKSPEPIGNWEKKPEKAPKSKGQQKPSRRKY